MSLMDEVNKKYENHPIWIVEGMRIKCDAYDYYKLKSRLSSKSIYIYFQSKLIGTFKINIQ
jgi:hypothetical protein